MIIYYSPLRFISRSIDDRIIVLKFLSCHCPALSSRKNSFTIRENLHKQVQSCIVSVIRKNHLSQQIKSLTTYRKILSYLFLLCLIVHMRNTMKSHFMNGAPSKIFFFTFLLRFLTDKRQRRNLFTHDCLEGALFDLKFSVSYCSLIS